MMRGQIFLTVLDRCETPTKNKRLSQLNIKDIYCGTNCSLMFNNNNKLLMLGDDTDFFKCIKRNGSSIDERYYPLKRVYFPGKCKKVGMGAFHAVLLNSNSRVYLYMNKKVKEIISLRFSKIVDIKCGKNHSLAISKNGTIYAWGHNEEGQLGNNNTINQEIPIEIYNIKKI